MSAGLLRGRTGRKGSAGKAQLPCELRMPHTTSIKVVGGTAIEINFMAVDSILGMTTPLKSKHLKTAADVSTCRTSYLTAVSFKTR